MHYLCKFVTISDLPEIAHITKRFLVGYLPQDNELISPHNIEPLIRRTASLCKTSTAYSPFYFHLGVIQSYVWIVYCISVYQKVEFGKYRRRRHWESPIMHQKKPRTMVALHGGVTLLKASPLLVSSLLSCCSKGNLRSVLPNCTMATCCHSPAWGNHFWSSD
jgi:hypothetical protein